MRSLRGKNNFFSNDWNSSGDGENDQNRRQDECTEGEMHVF